MSIHATAIVSDKAIIGNNVEIGAYTIIYDNVEISDNTVIEAFCEIGVSNHLSNGNKLYIFKIFSKKVTYFWNSMLS